MVAFTNLNEIVQHYKISRWGGVKEFKELQKRLHDVPVSLAQFEKHLNAKGCELSELITRAEFYSPQMRIFLLDDLVSYDEADTITEKMVLPYPIIHINGEPILDNFLQKTKSRLGDLILPDNRDPTSRVLSSPDCGAVAVVYERKDRIYYLEMVLTKDFL